MCCASRWSLALLCACVWAAALLSGGARAFHPVPDDLMLNMAYLGAKHILQCFPYEPYSHERITELALRRVLLEFLRDNPNAYSDAETIDAFTDTNAAHLGIDEYVDHLLQLHQNQTNVQQQEAVMSAFVAVANANRDVDKADTKEAREYSQDPKYHFDAEQFVESNQQIWWLVNESVGLINAGGDAAVGEARRYVGQALHTLQDFYAHSSWAEMHTSDELEIHGTLGVRGTNFSVAPPNVSTCVSECASGLCTNYLVQEALNAGYLTSGYFEHRDYGPSNRVWHDEQNRNVRKPDASVALKCSHGSDIDESRRRAPVGGINKDFNAASCGTDAIPGWSSFMPDFLQQTVELSPHYTQHKRAAQMAVKESIQLLSRLRILVNNDLNFGRFLGVSSIEPVTSVGLVVDTTGTMAKVLVAMREMTRSIIERYTRRGRTVRFVIVWFQDPDVGEPFITTDPKQAQQYVDDLRPFGGGDVPEMCFRAIDRALDKVPPRTPIFVFTEDESKEPHLLPEIIRKATEKKTPFYILLVKGSGFERRLLTDLTKPSRRRRRRLAEEKQKLQALLESRWNSYKRLAIASGGQLLDAGSLEDEQEIGRVSAVVDTLLSSSRVSLERRWNVSVRSLRYAPLSIAVDPTCARLDVLISVIATSSVHVQRTSFSLRPPSGNVLAPNFTSEQMTSFLVAAPAHGNWQLAATGAGAELPDARVQIAASCESAFDVDLKLLRLRNDSLLPTLEPIEGAPLVNATLIAIFKCPNESVQLSQLQLLNSETDELLQSVHLNNTGSTRSGWRFYAPLTIPRTSFFTKVVGTFRAQDGGAFGLSRVGATRIPMGLEFALAAADSTSGHTVEANGSLLLKATITSFGEPRNVNLSVTCDPSAPIASNWSTRHLALAAFRTHVVPLLVRAGSALANNSMVWVEVALVDADSLSIRVQRVYLHTRQKPPPPPPPRRATKRPEKEKEKPRGSLDNLPAVRSPQASPDAAAPAAADTPDVLAPVCRVELADFERECADAASCASSEWRAEFRFWDEPRATGRVHGVRLFVKSKSGAGDERRNWEQAARNASSTSWHKAHARPGDNFTYSVRASCCVHELRLQVSDQSGLAAHCNASFVYRAHRYLAPLFFDSIVLSIFCLSLAYPMHDIMVYLFFESMMCTIEYEYVTSGNADTCEELPNKYKFVQYTSTLQ